jgi:GDP-mannose transporter
MPYYLRVHDLSRHKGSFVLSSLSYATVSSLMVLCNKRVSGYFDSSWTLVLVQSFVATLILLVWTWMNKNTANRFSIKQFVSVLPLNALFLLMLYTNMEATIHLSVPLLMVFKNLGPVLTIAGDYVLFRQHVSTGTLFALFLMLAGAVAASFHDLDFNLIGCLWITLNSVTSSLYPLLAKFLHGTKQVSASSLALYNNGSTFFVVATLHVLTFINFDPNAIEYDQVQLLLISGVLGTLVGVCAFWCIADSSPSHFAILGALTKIPITLAGAFLFETRIESNGWVFIGLNLAGGCVYVMSKFESFQVSRYYLHKVGVRILTTLVGILALMFSGVNARRISNVKLTSTIVWTQPSTGNLTNLNIVPIQSYKTTTGVHRNTSLLKRTAFPSNPSLLHQKACPDALISGLPVDKVVRLNLHGISKTLVVPRFPTNVVIVQVPYEHGHKLFPRDDPRVTYNLRYARQRGFGFEVCFWDDLQSLGIVTGFAGHLTKPLCVLATQKKYHGSLVEWILLVDSDAVFNPLYLDHSLRASISGAGKDILTIVPANLDYDGCTGVMLVRTSTDGICLIQLWTAEVAGNHFLLWDQNAFWSVITRLWALKYPEKVSASECCRREAALTSSVQSMLQSVDMAWQKVQGKVLGGRDGRSLAPVMGLTELAGLYGGDRKRGKEVGYVWHPAGGGIFHQDDEAVLHQSKQGPWGTSWMFSCSPAIRFMEGTRLASVAAGHRAALFSLLPPHTPWITPASFRHLCAFRCEFPIGCNFRPADVKRGECVFISMTYSNSSVVDLGNFDAFELLRQNITNKFVLITHFISEEKGDFESLISHFRRVDYFLSWLESDLLTAWFSPHFRGKPSSNRTISIPSSFYSSVQYFEDEGFLGHCANRSTNGKEPLLIGPGSDHIVFKLHSIQNPSHWPINSSFSKSVCEHKFVACSSLPCIWEVLLLEGFPLIHASNQLGREFDSLPILTVEDWDDVNVEMLHENFDYFKKGRDFNIDKLFFLWWEDQVRFHQQV